MSDSTDTPPRPIEVLRAMVDATDRELLGLLARRTFLVSEIALAKRERGLKIRDFARERQILDDRGQRARGLGLPRDEIESIWRLILRASREHQAALRAELPIETEPRTVAIIGGRGEIGSVMARIFSDLGHYVLVADLETELSPVDAARMAEVVLVSVPIVVTERVIREIGPHVRPEGLLMDVTSIKAAPMAAMLESTRASVVGTHPMFGPGVHTLQGQRIVVCEGRGDRWASWVRSMVSARGLVVTDATSEQHDRVMALVQVLTHFQTQVLGLTLARSSVSLSESLAFTSPAYLMELYVAARHFAQAADLYGPIEMLNPRTAEVTEAFSTAAHELREILVARDQPRFDAVFEEVRAFFGEFTHEALEQSSYLIDRLVERS